MDKIFFTDWESIIRIACVTPLAYFSIILLLRVSGKRTLSKMNAFDFIVTVALGSVLASVALYQDIPLANGVTAMLSFILFQLILTWLSVRVEAVKTLITSEPSLIFYKGKFLEQNMKIERLTVEEIYSAARQKGLSGLDNIEMIVFETTGDISIIEKSTTSTKSTLEDVKMTL